MDGRGFLPNLDSLTPLFSAIIKREQAGGCEVGLLGHLARLALSVLSGGQPSVRASKEPAGGSKNRERTGAREAAIEKDAKTLAIYFPFC